MKYSGIDLHSNNSVVTVTDEEDRVMAEKRLPNDLATILRFLLPCRDELVGGVVESTYNLVLAGGWSAGSRLPGTFGPLFGDQEI